MHLAWHIVVCHWKLSILEKLDLVSLDNVFCDGAGPLVFHANLPLHVAQVVVAAKNLDQLLADVGEALLDHGAVVRAQTGEFVALFLGRLILIEAVALEQKRQLMLIKLALKPHRVEKQALELVELAGAVTFPVHESHHVLQFVEHTLLVEGDVQLLERIGLNRVQVDA